MITRSIFLFVALALIAAAMWAYHHDQKLDRDAAMINLGDPTREGECGSLTVAPRACTDEYVYRYYYSIFRPKYEVVWFNHSGKVIGEQQFERPF